MQSLTGTIIGFGYAGLSLAVEFGKHVPTISYDINNKRPSLTPPIHASESVDKDLKTGDIVKELRTYQVAADVYGPRVSSSEAEQEYGIIPVNTLKRGHYDASMIAVARQQFQEMGAQRIHDSGKQTYVLYDLKHLFPQSEATLRL